MNSTRTIEDALQDILEAAGKAQKFVFGMNRETFADDEKTQFAVIRALEIVGEAARRQLDPADLGALGLVAVGPLHRRVRDVGGLRQDVVELS